jgi:hypothetical protein
MKDFGENKCSPALNPVHSEEHKVFPKPLSLSTVYKKTYPGNSNCKTDSICESDEKNLAILEKKIILRKIFCPVK